jgi:hypothetical protein
MVRILLPPAERVLCEPVPVGDNRRAVAEAVLQLLMERLARMELALVNDLASVNGAHGFTLFPNDLSNSRQAVCGRISHK